VQLSVEVGAGSVDGAAGASAGASAGAGSDAAPPVGTVGCAAAVDDDGFGAGADADVDVDVDVAGALAAGAGSLVMATSSSRDALQPASAAQRIGATRARAVRVFDMGIPFIDRW
jgi:hypothetical protein